MHARNQRNANLTNMNNAVKNTLHAPLMSRVYQLDDYLDSVATLPNKRMQRIVVEPMLHQVSVLHIQAMRELRGLDYYKRAKDTLFEIQAAAFRIYHKKGWTLKVASTIDSMCDDIAEELHKRHFTATANPVKSKDEGSSADL